jgi:chorismate mutase-like protein
MNELTKLREDIDSIDYQIIDLLSQRFEVVKNVGEVKKLHQLPPLDPDRQKLMLEDRINYAKEMGVDKDFARKIFELVHDEAVGLQE